MSTCPICSTHLPDESKFCLECGYSITGGQTGRLNPDTMLENRYIIVKTLGRGGMGAVYLALDTRLNNKAVAIKEMSTNAVGSGNLQAAVGAFKKEASMLVNLHHPSLPIIRDFFAQGEDRWYLVMDYIEGQTLKQVADQRGAIPEADVLNWAHQLCEILSYLHTQKPPIIFRDLKPANIMLTPDGTIKLVDFGIARHFRPGLHADTTAYGSAGFTPPEQYGKNQTDERSDIYALGATLYFLLTGIDPHANPFHYEPLGKSIKISGQFEAAIMRCLEFKPENRPGSVEELLRLLPPVETRRMTSARGTVHLPSAGDETATLYLGANDDHGETGDNRPDPSKAGHSPRKGTKTILAAGLVVCLLAGGGFGVNYIKAHKSETATAEKGATADNPSSTGVQASATQSGSVAGIEDSSIAGNGSNGSSKTNSSTQAQAGFMQSQTGYDLVPVQVGGLWGYKDKTSGELIVQPQFSEVQGFSEGLALVKLGDKYGYISKLGNIAIEPQFYYADRFSEGLACAAMYPYTRGYIDKNANWIIYPREDWDFGTPFQNGQATINGHTVIDKTGKVIHDEMP